MSRVLLATLGSLGDLHPGLAVGRALLARGIAVRLATSTDYRARVEDCGLEFAPLAPSLAELGDPSEVAGRFFHRWLGPRRLFAAMVTTPMTRAIADLEAAATGVDLVVTHPLTPALPMIAERRGLPWLSTVLAPYSLFSSADPPVLPNAEWLHRLPRWGAWPHGTALALARRALRRWERPLHEVRRSMGLPPRDGSLLMDAQFSPHGTLALFDDVLASPQPDWPPRTLVCGAALHDAAEGPAAGLQPLEDFLARGAPPVVFALGSSAVWIARDYWRRAIAACEALGVRGLLLTGGPIADRMPPTVAAFDYLPYSRVFPRAAAVVHQCGIGTLSTALRSGRPQLLSPAGFDQPDNAARAARLGVGRVLPFRAAHRRGSVARELGRVLAEPRHARAAASIAATLQGADGAAVAADHVVAMLGRVRGAGRP